MAIVRSNVKKTFQEQDPFSVIKPEEYQALGIDPSDIPPGTFPARKHPPQLPSRFGGNAYGFGFFEIYDRLNRNDIRLLQSIDFDDREQVKSHYKDINQVYKRIGLLIRFSGHGKPYSLIPSNLISSTLSNIKNKADEIVKIIEFHRRKYLKESHRIGLLTSGEDSLVEDLSLRFKEHQFIIIESLDKLRRTDEILDLVIIPKDPFRFVLTDFIKKLSSETPSKKQLEKFVLFMLGKIYKILKPDGEIFIIANRHPMKTNQTANVTFKTVREKKNFLLFSHIFKTRKKYQIGGGSQRINVFDLEQYISGFYAEEEIIDELLGGKNIGSISLEKLDDLTYLNYPLDDELAYDQSKEWSKLLSFYFNEIFNKSLIPATIKGDWSKRFSIKDYSPGYMLIYLGQKKPPETSFEELNRDIAESKLAGCPYPLLADYRDSFDYLIQTLHVLNNIKKEKYSGIPALSMERLRMPLENKRLRYSGLNNVVRLMSKVTKLEKISSYLNPDMIEGSRTRLLRNLDLLPFFGINYAEIKEILLIIVGHTTMGRILSGKMNEKTLKPVTDKARSFDLNEAVNLLRYCRLMSVAETVASQRTELKQGQVGMLFDLYDSMTRIVTSRELEWDRLLDEKIIAAGGINNIIIQKLLKMMNLFEFIENWQELKNKGDMEKESLADYDEEKLRSIEKIIRLLNVIANFEQKYQKKDPLIMPIFYRRLNNMEFHGTGHVFSRIKSDIVFILLWISVNVNRGEVINFNPIFSNIEYSSIDSHMQKVEKEAGGINRDYLDLATLKQFEEQLYENESAFIVNTGFRLSVNKETNAIDISFIDMDDNIQQLEELTKKIEMYSISDIPPKHLERIESLFSNLESFYQGHLRLIAHDATTMRIPERQNNWAKKTGELREFIMGNFIEVLFQPENIYEDLRLLYLHSPTILHFILPEFLALKDLKPVNKIYLRSPLIEHILKSTKKLQALIRRDRKEFQDISTLHKLAQREFGPMTAGIVGLNEIQIGILENIIEKIRHKAYLFDALIKAFIFQDLGLIPELRDKYKDRINTTDQAQAGAVLLEALAIPQRYNMDKEAKQSLAFLIKMHDRLHHIVRGEFSILALEEAIESGDKDLFDAFFLSSFVMFSALGDDLIMEDLAENLFRIRILCHHVIDGMTTLSEYIKGLYREKGRLFYLLEEYREKGLPEKMTPNEYLEIQTPSNIDEKNNIKAGGMIYALERLLKLRGLRYVEFPDLAARMIKIPLRYIYQKKNCYGIGYATFEKELFEALRLYNGIYRLPEDARHFILERLEGDQIRIFGFENVSVFLNYENIIKLLLIALIGSLEFRKKGGPVCLDFLPLMEKIEKRYEVVNDLLNNMSVAKIWEEKDRITRLFKEQSGIIFKKDEKGSILICDFIDKIKISTKIKHMESIVDIDQLKNYFHYSLQSLRKTPFYTEDYEYELEDAFYRRLSEIIDLMLDQAQKQIELLTDFREMHNLYSDLLDRSLEIGFSDDQKHRLSDIYEFRKDQLKREKLNEINRLLVDIHDIEELRGYWDGVKYYLLDNRSYLGKEFEQIIAKKFDDIISKLQEKGPSK